MGMTRSRLKSHVYRVQVGTYPRAPTQPTT